MILRRLMTHVRDQNWFAVCLDFVIVVVGVMMAFQVTAWNDDRQQRQTEAAYLRSLADDVAQSVDAIRTMQSGLEAQQAALEHLYDLHSGERTEVEADTLARLLSEGLFFLAQTELNLTTYDTLVGSGQLTTIDSPELIAALQRLNGLVGVMRINHNDEYQATIRFTDPILMRDFDLHDTFRQPPYRVIDWLESSRPMSTDLTPLRQREFGNVVLYRAYLSDIVLFRAGQMLATLDEISALIEVRSAELGGDQ